MAVIIGIDVYLASPYSHKDPFVREWRYLRTMRELGRLLRRGLIVYSPIVHCHELAKIADLPRDAKFWERYNFRMIDAASQLLVLMLPGWEESVGIADEVKHAEETKKHILYIEESTDEQEAQRPARS